jgi:hypothetical protein
MVEAILLLGEKFIDLFDENHEFVGVLLGGCLLAQDFPAFFGFTLHQHTRCESRSGGKRKERTKPNKK